MDPVQDDVEIETSGEQSDVFAVSSSFQFQFLYDICINALKAGTRNAIIALILALDLA